MEQATCLKRASAGGETRGFADSATITQWTEIIGAKHTTNVTREHQLL